MLLMKMRERNSSLQERLNMSFNLAKLDQSSMSYRQQSSMQGKKVFHNIDRKYLSMPKEISNEMSQG